jgi:hypothetical protein
MNFAGLINWKPKAKFQERIIGELCEHRHSTLQGLRQNVGKTECVALCRAASLTAGRNVGIGTPLLEIGGRVVIDRIARMMYAAQEKGGVPITKPDTMKYKRWENGAYMGLVSLYDSGDEMKGKGVQGWTFHDLVIDEAHECRIEVFEKLTPTLNVAREDKDETSVCIGVGGVRTDERETCSLIVLRKETPGVHPILITPEEIVASNPDKYGPFIEELQQEWSERQWKQHALCEDILVHGDGIFPRLEREGDPGYIGADTWIEVGIDVGDSNKATLVGAIEVIGRRAFSGMDAATVVDVLEIDGTLPYETQVQQAADWIVKYDGRLIYTGITVERNGPGKRFLNCCKDNTIMRGAKGMWTSDNNQQGKPGSGRKSRLIENLMDMAAQGRLGCRPEKWNKALKRLQYEQKPDGSYDWPHSHILSVLWIWYSRRGGVFSV